MHYSLDLRRKVISAVERGASQSEVARLFGISRKTIYNWRQREDLAPSLSAHRHRKTDVEQLKALVKSEPDLRQIDYAQRLGVSNKTISYQFKKWGIRKKKDPLRGTLSYQAD